MDEFIYNFTYAINFLLCAATFAATRSILSARGDVKVNLNRFSAVAIVAGLVSGVPLLYSLLWLLESAGHRVNVGHGEGLIVAPLLSFVIGLLLAGVGRILLQWHTIKW
ncbi:MAG TPA: hypothetical protein VF861_00300 [Telluria sp.]